MDYTTNFAPATGSAIFPLTPRGTSGERVGALPLSLIDDVHVRGGSPSPPLEERAGERRPLHARRSVYSFSHGGFRAGFFPSWSAGGGSGIAWKQGKGPRLPGPALQRRRGRSPCAQQSPELNGSGVDRVLTVSLMPGIL